LVTPSLFTTFTITTNTVATNFNPALNHIGISGDSFNTDVSAESFNDADGVLSHNIASATFLGGSSSKSIELEFNNIIDFFREYAGRGQYLGLRLHQCHEDQPPGHPRALDLCRDFRRAGLPRRSLQAETALVGAIVHRRRKAV
jgi:hypothetical protein